MIWIVSLVLLYITSTTAPASFTHLSTVILSYSSLTVLVAATKWSPRHVDTKYGVAQGFVVYPKEGFDGVEVLLNMPFASSPIGNLRFMPPVSAAPWTGVRKSDKPGQVCPQALPDIRNETEALKNMPKGKLQHLKRLLPHLKNQSEDCLYLNLYIPLKVAEERTREKLPVLVFIHGDDYGYGAGFPYDPTMMVSFGNIIVVNLNYRLGIFGFLNANSDSHFRLPFNFAMLDQIAALQWIQENIALFGGDRFNVTLLGHGKGAVLVNFLMISSAVPTGLLFHRVILSSGSALSPSASDLSYGPELSKRFALKVRCPPEPSQQMLECLREVSVRQFLESELWSLFGPSGDGIVLKNDFPPDTVIMNKASHYPLLFGVTKVEALPELNNHDATYGMEAERRKELLKMFIHKHYRFHRNEILAGAIHEYTDWEKPVQHPQNVRDETLEALADAQVIAPMTRVGDLITQSSRSRAYFYVFEYQSKSSAYQQRLGCVHGEDLTFTFGVPLYFYDNDSASSSIEDLEMTRTDISGGGDYVSVQTPKEKVPQESLGFFAPANFTWYEVQLSMTKMRLWANFVRVGNPNGDLKMEEHYEDHLPPLETTAGGKGVQEQVDFPPDSNRLKKKQQTLPSPIFVEWPQYESLDKKYLVLDLRPRIKSHYRAHKLSFWIHLVPDYQKNEEGTSITSLHHGILHPNTTTSNKKEEVDPRRLQSSLEKVSPSPTVQASGLYDLSQGSEQRSIGSHNSSKANSNSPKLSLPGGGIDHQKEQQDSGENHISNSDEEESSFGFSSYSTALSVTIAIGCSLLILNILIFATFYYEREKRLNALRRSTSNSGGFTSSSHHQQQYTFSQAQQKHSVSASPRQKKVNTGTTPTSRATSLKRRKENGGVGVVGIELGLSQTASTSFYAMEMGGEEREFGCIGGGDLHLSAYDDEDRGERSLGPVTSAATQVNYGNCPIKRYSNSTISRNRSRRPINELGMPIDMSESVTNEPNFSPQSSRTVVQIGTTFVGIEEERRDEDEGKHYCHFRPHHHLLRQDSQHDNSNSSFEDRQSS